MQSVNRVLKIFSKLSSYCYQFKLSLKSEQVSRFWVLYSLLRELSNTENTKTERTEKKRN